MNRNIDDKTKEEMIEELKLEVESIQNELDNIVHELGEFSWLCKDAIIEIQDFLKDTMKFWPVTLPIKKVD